MTKRRTLFCAALAAALLPACGKKDTEQVRPPVPFGKHDRCLICGMAIANYGGPKGQVLLKGVDEAAKFCSVRDAFTFALQPENQRRLEAIYVNDMAKTEWGKPLDGPLVEAKSLFFVFGSDKKGAMGASLVPFTTESAALAFQKDHGGNILRYGDITLDRLSRNKQPR